MRSAVWVCQIKWVSSKVTFSIPSLCFIGQRLLAEPRQRDRNSRGLWILSHITYIEIEKHKKGSQFEHVEQLQQPIIISVYYTYGYVSIVLRHIWKLFFKFWRVLRYKLCNANEGCGVNKYWLCKAQRWQTLSLTGLSSSAEQHDSLSAVNDIEKPFGTSLSCLLKELKFWGTQARHEH